MAVKATASITLIRVNDADSVDIGGRNYVVDRAGTASYSANGMTIEYLEDAYFHIYGTNTGDAAYSLGEWLIDNDLLVAGQVYTISTTVPIPEGVYLQLNTKETSEGTEVGAGITSLSGDGETLSSTGVCHDPTTGYAHGFFGIRPTAKELDITFRIKFEKGNRATDWTPAPEDTDQKLDDQKVELQSSIDTAIETSEDGIIQTVTETFTTKDDFQTEVGLLQTQLTQTQEDFTFQFNTVNSSLTDLDAFKGEAGTRLDTISKYIRFLNGDILLGGSDSDVQLKIENDRIAFLDNNNEVMYISNEELYIMRAIIATQLTIGNFSWVPRSNGNVSFRYIGD